jgi:hypothetical protein
LLSLSLSPRFGPEYQGHIGPFPEQRWLAGDVPPHFQQNMVARRTPVMNAALRLGLLYDVKKVSSAEACDGFWGVR